ncbi:hypothetical protein [Nonomuraea aurantiaca]|uniref:hypothetical protein n=1 Tax=Nonomuraea aurantiaca TaxID=2878562 RepID=UPI003558BF9D
MATRLLARENATTICQAGRPLAAASRSTMSCSRSTTRFAFQILSARLTRWSSRLASEAVHEAWVRAKRASRASTPWARRSS